MIDSTHEISSWFFRPPAPPCARPLAGRPHVSQASRSSSASNGNFKPTGASFLLPPLRMGWSMSVTWARISTPSTSRPVRSSGSLLPKVPVVSSPALAGGIVYFASDDGKFYAPDAATDQLKWKLETAGERRYAGRHLHGLLPAADTMPDPWDYFLLLPRCGTVPCISVAAMATCMPWTPCRAA
jgi:hypothetical protein